MTYVEYWKAEFDRLENPPRAAQSWGEWALGDGCLIYGPRGGYWIDLVKMTSASAMLRCVLEIHENNRGKFFSDKDLCDLLSALVAINKKARWF